MAVREQAGGMAIAILLGALMTLCTPSNGSYIQEETFRVNAGVRFTRVAANVHAVSDVHGLVFNIKMRLPTIQHDLPKPRTVCRRESPRSCHLLEEEILALTMDVNAHLQHLRNRRGEIRRLERGFRHVTRRVRSAPLSIIGDLSR